MKNAAKTSLKYDDDELGLADDAAVMGPDGGPIDASPSTDLTLYDDFGDDDWLNEELSDEELEALGEEDFDLNFDEDLIEGDLDDQDDFDLIEPAPAQLAKPKHYQEPEPDQSAWPGQDAAQSGQSIGDDLFDLDDDEGVAEDHAVSADGHNIEDSVFGEDELSYSDDDLSSETQSGQGNGDHFDENVDDYTVDDEFSIEDDYSDDEDFNSVNNAVVVAAQRNEVKAKKEGSVASPDASDATSDSVNNADMNFEEDDDDLSEFEDDGTYHRPVPRISIHAFCETTRNSAMLERSAVDRRLSKAHFTMHMGGIEKAIDIYQSSSTPNLIILETVIGGMGLIQQLGQLAEVCDPSTKVIIVGHVNDIRLYRELIRNGISEYIVRPKSPLQIIKTISELYVDPSAPPIGKTIAFVGTRGGVGSSTLAHNIGWGIAENFESDTVILDLDLAFGTTALDFDHEPTSGLMEALSSPERLDDVLLERLLQKHTDHLSLFTAPNLLDRDYDIEDDSFETVIDVVRGAAPNIVIDLPHQWTPWSKKILQTADEIVITATPDFASFRNMKYLVEIIGSARPNDSRPYFVYNQFDPKASAVPVEYFVENVELEPSLILGWEPQLFNAAATNASPIIEVSPKSKVALGMNELAGKIIGRNEVLALPSRFSLTSLFKRN